MAASTSKGIKHSMSAPPDCEVKIPIVRTKENVKKLPTYAAALQRSNESSLAAEDLDSIQLELETLLSNAAVRYRVLKSEYESLDKDEKRSEKKKHATGGEKPPASPAAVIAEGKSTSGTGKRKRDESSGVRKPKHTLASSLKQSKHNKNSPLGLNTDDSMDYTPTGSQSHHHLQKLTLPKNDTPNKFWLSVEPYCMPLTNEDLRLIDDLLDQYNASALVPPIPELGQHYSTAWATEDIKDIQQASNPNTHGNRFKQQNNAAGNILKKADNMIDDTITGPLTQRLVTALMEEQLVQNPTDLIGAPDSSNSSSENTHSSSQLNFRSLSLLRNCVGIEKRVKKELIEQGILDSSDFPNNDEDEILSEIKRVIAELSAVAEYNISALKRLRESAAEEIKRLEIKRKLDAIDQEILETYKRCMQNKAKRKPLSQQEQQEIFRLTAEQKTLSDQLERAQANCAIYE